MSPHQRFDAFRALADRRGGPATFYADLAAPHGRRHVRVCTAAACFAARAGRHVREVEDALGVGADQVTADGEVSLQSVRCLGYCQPASTATPRTRAHLIVEVNDDIIPGQVFCAFHFPASGVNALTSDRGDTATSCPEYKVTAVRLERVPTGERPGQASQTKSFPAGEAHPGNAGKGHPAGPAHSSSGGGSEQ